MKRGEISDFREPFVICANSGCYYFAICVLCLFLFLWSLGFMIASRRFDVILFIVLAVSGAGALLFRWLGYRQPDSQERLLVISDRGIGLPEYGMAKAVFISWERFSSAEALLRNHQSSPQLVLTYRDPATCTLKSVERSLVQSRYEPDEVIEIIEQYRDHYWEMRKERPMP